MHGDDLPNILSVASIALTAVVVWFAWQTVREARRATAEEQNAVAELESLVAAAQQTADIAATAQAADWRHRQLEQLRAIGRLVVVIRTRAEEELAKRPYEPKAWRCMEQSQLESELVGVVPPLPKCRALVGENQASQVKSAADQANAEVRGAFHDLGVRDS